VVLSCSKNVRVSPVEVDPCGFLDRPSATRILPEFQQLAMGDTIPWGRTELTVGVVEPLRALASPKATRPAASYGCGSLVCIRLTPTGHDLLRVAPSAYRASWSDGWACESLEPSAFIMTRRMMLNVKERVEALRASAD
jgi:hypothetical protein